MFEIHTTDERLPESETDGAPVILGKIVIDNFRETFAPSLSFWTRDQYEMQWIRALEKLVAGEDRSALITDYVEPPTEVTSNSYLVWWPMYREGDTIFVQNHLLFFHQLSRPFSLDRFWESVPDRRIVGEEGQKVSEWVTTVQDIRDFLDSRERKGTAADIS